MKRSSYVDNQGNPIDHGFESKKTFLNIFFVVGTIIPIIIIGFIIYTMFDNAGCNKIYKEVEGATYEYLKDKEKLPIVEGENVKISIDKLYSGNYLSELRTNNMICSGNVKTTKYKSDYVYTLELTSCNQCTTNGRYAGFSKEFNSKPNKPLIDVIPYYNYYERQVAITDASNYFEQSELNSKTSKYGVKLPKDLEEMPEVPEEGNIVDVQKDEKYQYRYKDLRWKWYDIVGNYSSFASEQPAGYANKDTSTKRTTEWSEYSLNYPEEKEYRDIKEISGYKYYYEEDGKKHYANNGKYTASTEVDQQKYDKREQESSKLYQYSDTQWRWYNGQKRRYSGFSSNKPQDYNFKDDDLVTEASFSSWKDQSENIPGSGVYRTEEKRLMTRYRYVYEILSLPFYDKPVTKEQFVKDIKMTVPEFSALEEYKLEVTYKFKYRVR